nr:amino acid permease 6-like [Ipomoea batatas]
MERTSSVVVQEGGAGDSLFDDDGRIKRTGTVITASAHIITAIIGSGALSLAWAVAQLGSLPGSVALLVFSVITLYTSILLTDCYRSPEGTRNYSYMDAVRTHLGGIQYMFCALAQYATLIGLGIGYVITTALSIGAIERTNCYHKYGHDWPNCSPSTRNYIIEFGAVQMILSQVSNFHKLSFISMVAAIMSFTYSIIGIALSAVRIAGGTPVTTSVTGVPIDNNTSAVDKMWKTFSALGNIAIAFAFSIVVIEIQASLSLSQPLVICI